MVYRPVVFLTVQWKARFLPRFHIHVLILSWWVQLEVKYSETCIERPLPRETTCLEGPHTPGRKSAFQCNSTCHQRPPVLRDHIFVANGVVFQERFYCTLVHMYM